MIIAKSLRKLFVMINFSTLIFDIFFGTGNTCVTHTPLIPSPCPKADMTKGLPHPFSLRTVQLGISLSLCFRKTCLIVFDVGIVTYSASLIITHSL